MFDLHHYLLEHFGGLHAGGERMVAISEAHAVHEAGYEVAYSRYAVNYRDMQRTVSFGAEFDDEGTLIVHSAETADRIAVERIDQALRFLGVRFRHD
jgi:hypothetical protein